MIFEYAVIHDGKFYCAGEDVPMEQSEPEQITIDDIEPETEQEPVTVKGVISELKSVLDEPKRRGRKPRK